MDPPRTDLSGVLLAGGASRRMGRDKALLPHRGETLAARVLRVLDAVCDDVVVASGDGVRLTTLARPQVADDPAGRGPLAGLVAGLDAAAHPLVAVVAVDMPDASGALLVRLAAAWDGEAGVVPFADGRLQPLHAVWARTAAPALRARLAAGRAGVTAAATALGVRVLEVDDARFARNLNQPEDLT